MKIGFFITARLKSSRLKQKILLDLNGKSVLDRVIERTKKVTGIDGVVLCTSTNPQDSVLYKNALSNHIEFYAGSEGDVLKRLLDAAEYYGYDAFVSVTADNPLFSIYTAEIAVDWYKKNGCDFIFTKGLPIGITTYFLDVNALSVAIKMKKELDTEIWGPFVNRPDFFNIGEIQIMNSPYKEELRLTCDFVEDYNLINKIYSAFNSKVIIDIFQIFKLLQENDNYIKINKMHNQLKVSQPVLESISLEFDKNKELGMKYAQKINKKLIPGFSSLKVNI